MPHADYVPGARLEERGLAMERLESMPSNLRRAVISDPGGNTITLFERPET